MLELPSQPREFVHVELPDRVVVEKGDAMRIAHRDRSYLGAASTDLERMVDDFAVGIDRDFAPLENRLAHVDRRAIDLAVAECQRDAF